MKHENEDGWETKIGKECQNSKPDCIPRGLGAFSATGTQVRNDSIRVSGTDRQRSSTSLIRNGAKTPGGIARQLIDQAQKQLAYHKAQVSELEERIQELEQFTQNLVETEEYSE